MIINLETGWLNKYLEHLCNGANFISPGNNNGRDFFYIKDGELITVPSYIAREGENVQGNGEN